MLPRSLSHQTPSLISTSALKKNYFAVNLRCKDKLTKPLAAALGCNSEEAKGHKGPCAITVIGIDATNLDGDPTVRRPLPPVSNDGPFGGAPKSISLFEAASIFALGDGLETYASILKSVWSCMNYATQSRRLHKVYFFWACENFKPLKWLVSLLKAIEARDMDEGIEIYTYLTENASRTTATHEDNYDVMEGFRVPTKLGTPDRSAMITAVAQHHASGTAYFITSA